MAQARPRPPLELLNEQFRPSICDDPPVGPRPTADYQELLEESHDAHSTAILKSDSWLTLARESGSLLSRDRHLVVNGAFLPYNSSGAVVFNSGNGQEIRGVTRDQVRFGNGHRFTSIGALASFESRTEVSSGAVGFNRARLIDLETGRVLRSVEHGLKPGKRLRFWGETWTHDGSKVVAIPYDGGEIKILDIKSGRMTTGAKGVQSSAHAAIVSPDNSRLAIKSGSNPEDKPEVRLFDLSTGEEIVRINLPERGRMYGFSPDSKTFLVGGSEFVIYHSENGEAIRTLKLLDDARFSYDK